MLVISVKFIGPFAYFINNITTDVAGSTRLKKCAMIFSENTAISHSRNESVESRSVV